MNLLIHPSLPSNFVAVAPENSKWTATHWTMLGNINATDVEILAHASRHGDVVVSAGLGLRHLVASMKEGTPSLMQIRGADSDLSTAIVHASAALQQMECELLEGALVTLTIASTGNTLRVLPIGRGADPAKKIDGAAFSRDAFLSEGQLLRAEWSEPVRQLGQLCININRLSVMRLLDVKVSADDAQAALSLLLFSQATTGFEASCLLAGTGMEGEARAQARNCVEAAIVCYAHAAKPELDVIAKLNVGYKRHYVTWLKALQDGINLQEGEPLDSHIRQSISNIDVSEGSSIKLEQLAKDAGIEDIYSVLYRFLSADGGHPTWDSLRKAVVHDEISGQLVGISIRPRYESIGETLAIAAQCQLVALKGLQLAFPDQDIDDMVLLYVDALRHLATLKWTRQSRHSAS